MVKLPFTRIWSDDKLINWETSPFNWANSMLLLLVEFRMNKLESDESLEEEEEEDDGDDRKEDAF